MKRFFLTLAGFCLAAMVQAQATFRIEPATATAEDEITLIVNVANEPRLAGVEPLYIWAFKSGCCGAPNNGEWTSSDERHRMTRVSANEWSFKFRPTDMLQRTPAQIGTSMGFLVKGKDGSGNPERKSDDLTINLEPVTYRKEFLEVFPRRFSANDLITITFDFNQFKAENPNHGLTQANPSELWFFSQTQIKTGSTIGGWTESGGPGWCDVGASQMKLTPIGGGVYVIRMVPNQFFRVPAGSNAAAVKVNVRNQNAWCTPSQNGHDVGDRVWNTLEY